MFCLNKKKKNGENKTSTKTQILKKHIFLIENQKFQENFNKIKFKIRLKNRHFCFFSKTENNLLINPRYLNSNKTKKKIKTKKNKQNMERNKRSEVS